MYNKTKPGAHWRRAVKAIAVSRFIEVRGMTALFHVTFPYSEDSERDYLAGSIIWRQVLDMQLS